MNVTIEQDGREEVSLDAAGCSTLLEALRRAGIGIDAPCGGAGVCGKCAVDVMTSGGWVEMLACQTTPCEGMRVRLAAERGAVQVERDAAVFDGIARRFAPDPASPGDIGIAVDLGTTTVACYAVDLETGEVVASGGETNPQAAYGADVISRIQACSEGRLDELQSRAASCIGRLARDLCAQAQADPARIMRWSIAGNTVMEHIACGISPEGIGVFPFTPQTLFGDVRSVPGAADAAYLAPCVSGYVGGDIVAGVVACGMDEATGNVLFADLGTNGEMALRANGELLCCATATGPAFEGANIAWGMPARDGAIAACRFEDGALRTEVIGGGAPAGICGSGLIDALAACLDAGLVDETGRMAAPDEAPAGLAHLVCLHEGQPAVRLSADGSVLLTQKDVRALQLAKASVCAGLCTLLDKAGVVLSDVDAFLVGGAFGAHVRPAAAARIGLFPRELLPVTRMVGNCAGAGAVAAVLSGAARERMTAAAQAARYIELSTDADFSETYLDSMEFEEEL